MDETNETDKTREQTAKEPENASHLPDKLVAQRREVAEKVARDMEELGCGPVARKVALKRWMQRGIA